MTFKSQEKNNIRVLTSISSKKILIIFFPSAATSFTDYQIFLDNISKEADIVYVYAGYNGLIVNDKTYKPYSLEDFTEIFDNSFKCLTDKYKKIILLGQSFGVCIAYKLSKKIKRSKLILVSPPFSEKSFRYNTIGKIFLNLLTVTSAGKNITNFLEPSFIKLCSKFRLNTSQQLFVKAIKRAGTVNYFSCLRETLKYGLIDNEILSEDIIMVYGKQDPFLNNFCKQENLHKRKNSYFLDYGHTILQKEWKFILKFI